MNRDAYRTSPAGGFAADLPVCYRHPDRETRLACSRCGRSVCVECVRPADVGQRCPECVSRPAERGGALRVASEKPYVTYGLMAASVAVFAAGFLIPDVGRMLFLLGAQDNQVIAEGQWWRLLTAPFLHAGLTHLLFNMWALYVFGPQLERQVGGWAFAAMYLAAGVAGGAAFFLSGSSQSAVGASGAIFGLFGAWLVAAYRNRHRRGGRASFRQLAILLGINLALPVVFPNIAWQAHLGGLVAGGVVAALWLTPPLRGADKQTPRTLVGLGVAATALLAVLA